MKNLIFACMITALLGLIISDPVVARGGGASTGGSSGVSSGGRHFGGGARHFRGTSRSFGGSQRHFRSTHSHHRHNRYNFGFNVGYYSPGYYGYRSYGYRPYGYRSYGYGYRPYGYRPYYWPPFYGYPSYYQRNASTAPIVYIQREEIKTVKKQSNYWHYCRNPEGYYPYVKKCPEGWLQVAPQPPVQH